MTTRSPSPLRAVLTAIVLVAGAPITRPARAADAPAATAEALEQAATPIRRIAFGSCGHQDKPQPILRTVVGRDPDLFIYLGDNVYGDTRDMEVLRDKYERLGSKEEFRALRDAVPVLSIWDDHDYGENDAGREYPMKAESKEIFLDFWRVPDTSPRRRHEGIHGSHRFGPEGRRVQVLLLDTRTFRDPLRRNPEKPAPPFKNDYRPDPDPDKTILGDDQWRWLEARLREPAELRIIATSIQFGHEYNGWESWTNLPAERKRMIDTIRRTRANGVVFISGDVHWGEISIVEVAGGYPLHDVTASGLTETWPDVEPNGNRFGEVVRDNHFGEIQIEWDADPPAARLRIVDRPGTIRVEKSVPFAALRF